MTETSSVEPTTAPATAPAETPPPAAAPAPAAKKTTAPLWKRLLGKS